MLKLRTGMNVGLTMYATLQLIPHAAEDSETGSMHSIL